MPQQLLDPPTKRRPAGAGGVEVGGAGGGILPFQNVEKDVSLGYGTPIAAKPWAIGFH
jgi:hypothetical protein